MVLRVKPTPTRFPTNNGQHTVAFYIKCVLPVGRPVVVPSFRGIMAFLAQVQASCIKLRHSMFALRSVPFLLTKIENINPM